MEQSFSNWLKNEVKSLGIMWKHIAERLNLAPDRVTWRVKKDSFTFEEEYIIRELIDDIKKNVK